MTEKILNQVADFLKTNQIEGLDLGKIVESLPVDEIRAMISGKDEYVVKRSGHLEKYNADKIARSIKNTADRSGLQINSSDIAIILKDVYEKLFRADSKRLAQTTKVMDVVLEALDKEGFSKIRDAYASYSQN